MTRGFGLGWGILAFQLFNIAILLAWLILSIICLVRLGKSGLPSNSKAVWTLIILLIPIMGSIAYLIVKPGDENKSVPM